MFKLLFVFTLMVSSFSHACEDIEKNESQFLKDVKIIKLEGESCINISLLFDEYNHAENRYISSALLNIQDTDKNLIASVTPDLRMVGYGQVLVSACIDENHIDKSTLLVYSAYKESIRLASGLSHSVGGMACHETAYIELGKAIREYN